MIVTLKFSDETVYESNDAFFDIRRVLKAQGCEEEFLVNVIDSFKLSEFKLRVKRVDNKYVFKGYLRYAVSSKMTVTKQDEQEIIKRLPSNVEVKYD